MILLDHCVPRKFKKIIENWGYPATLLNEHTSVDASDNKVIELAQELDAVLLTVDLDFANILNYPPQDYVGIIVVRYTSVKDEISIMATLRQALETLYREDLRHSLLIIGKNHYRLRK